MSEAIRGGNLNDAVLDEDRGLYVHPTTGETWSREVGDASRGIGVGYTMSEGLPPDESVSRCARYAKLTAPGRTRA